MSNTTNKFKAKMEELFSIIKKEKFADAELMDGSILRSDSDLTKGAKVTLVTKEGAAIAIADGEYTLKDGTKITVKSSVIDSITDSSNPLPTDVPMTKPIIPGEQIPMAEPVAGVPTDATPAVEDPSVDAKISQTIEDLTARVAALEAKLGEQISANTEMSKTVEKMAAQPGAEPIKRKNAMEFPYVVNEFSNQKSNFDTDKFSEEGLNEMLKFRNKK